jgi:hypothetical protein
LALGKLLLISVHFVHFRTHMSITTTYLATKDVASLGGSTWLTLDGARSISMYFSDHLHLIGVVHDKFFGVSSVSGGYSLSSIYNFALGSNCWNLVIILLNWRKIKRLSLLKIKIRLNIVDRRFRFFQ